MLKSKYIFILVAAMSCLGFVFQKQKHAPNQEIVLQFNSVQIASNEVQTAISSLKKRLYGLGADNIKLVKCDNDVLRITYYSDIDVSSIKHLFSKDKDLASCFNVPKPSNTPFNNKNTKDYQFQINEIQKDQPLDNGLNAVFLVDFDPKSDHRYCHVDSFFVSYFNYSKDLYNVKTVSRLISSNNSFVLHDITKSNPEVRAGPKS